ncbi:unnamed protein product, partial [Polarella glacialis]
AWKDVAAKPVEGLGAAIRAGDGVYKASKRKANGTAKLGEPRTRSVEVLGDCLLCCAVRSEVDADNTRWRDSNGVCRRPEEREEELTKVRRLRQQVCNLIAGQVEDIEGPDGFAEDALYEGRKSQWLVKCE